MRSNHLGPCLALAGLAAAVMVGLGVGVSSLAPFAVFLLCPLIMGAAFWWIARRSGDYAERGDHPSQLR